jgi:hypothetical protein
MDYLRAVCLVRAMVDEMRFGDGRVGVWSGLMGGREFVGWRCEKRRDGEEDEGGANICSGRKVSE